MIKIQHTKPEVADLIPIRDYAEGDEYSRGSYLDLIDEDDIILQLDDFDRDLVLALRSDDKFYSMGSRYGLCQSKMAWKVAMHKVENEKVKTFQMTCDNRFCDCPPCVKRRKARLKSRYKSVFDSLYNPNPRSRKNLRGMELTSNIQYTCVDDLDRFTKEMRKFLKKEKRVFKFVAGIHINQGTIHAHIVYYGFFIPSKDLSSKWKDQTGWSNTNIKQLKGGVDSHIGHLTKYLAKPLQFKDKDVNQMAALIKELYNKRLVTASGIKPEDLPVSEWQVLPGIYVSERQLALISTYRNNSTSKDSDSVRSSILFYMENNDYG